MGIEFEFNNIKLRCKDNFCISKRIYLQQADLQEQLLGHWQLPWHLHSDKKEKN